MDYNKFEDKYFKTIAGMYIQDLIRCFGYDYRIRDVLENDIVVNSAISMRLDLLAITYSNILINIEFLSTKLTKKLINRFHDYSLRLWERYGKKVLTIVVSTFEDFNGRIVNEFGIGGVFTIHFKSFTQFDAKKALNDIKYKIKNNEPFSNKDFLTLSLIPFMESREGVENLLWKVCELIGQIRLDDEEDVRLDSIRFGMIVLIEKFVTDKDRKKEFFELINMYGNYYYELYGKEQREQGRLEGRLEGLSEGRSEGFAELIRKLLKSGLSVEDLSNRTGLSIEEIESLF